MVMVGMHIRSDLCKQPELFRHFFEEWLQLQAVDLIVILVNSVPARSTIARTDGAFESATAGFGPIMQRSRAPQNAADTWPGV